MSEIMRCTIFACKFAVQVRVPRLALCVTPRARGHARGQGSADLMIAMAAIAALHVAGALAAVTAAAAAAAAAPPPAPPPSNVSYISSVRYPMEGGNTITLCTSP
eukprot:SAG22_NODE_990_length_6131_cov_3.233588_5_plen_105_part_00